MNARKAIFAGSWYPDSAWECEKEINGFLKEIKVKDSLKGKGIGGIVPHAGWHFSGSIGCNVINCLKDEKHTDVIIIFGMHLHPDSPCYIMKEGAWETPFGEIEIEKNIAQELTEKYSFDIETPENFIQDNTIELQLPFIKYFFGDVKIVPIGAPPVKESFEIGKAAAEIATKMGLCAKVIGSTDLTHYGVNYGFMPEGIGAASLDWVRNENDRRIIDVMLTVDPDAVIREAMAHQNACCSGAAATAIACAKQLGAKHAESIAYATSYDKSPGDSFVGYAGIVFTD
ncbi:MAG: AmmeMemoRadiSam system protein B [Thermodesulfobacteriota bacterium]|nr:AmmeMemoRadiSam system protein B [Thermodesulfobacteriota bacterium]